MANNWIMEILMELDASGARQMILAIINHVTGECETRFEDRHMRLIYKIIVNEIDRG